MIVRPSHQPADKAYFAMQKCAELAGALVVGHGATHYEALTDCLARIERIKAKTI